MSHWDELEKALKKEKEKEEKEIINSLPLITSTLKICNIINGPDCGMSSKTYTIYEILSFFKQPKEAFNLSLHLQQFYFILTNNKKFDSLDWLDNTPISTFEKIGPKYLNAIYAITWIQEFYHKSTGHFFKERDTMHQKLVLFERIRFESD